MREGALDVEGPAPGESVFPDGGATFSDRHRRFFVGRRMHRHAARRNGEREEADRLVGTVRQDIWQIVRRPTIHIFVPMNLRVLLREVSGDRSTHVLTELQVFGPILQQTRVELVFPRELFDWFR